MAVNPDFFEAMGMEMKEGRFFSGDFGTDTTKVIFNEAAIEVMGLDNPIIAGICYMRTLYETWDLIVTFAKHRGIYMCGLEKELKLF